jgi:hypothetical protein
MAKRERIKMGREMSRIPRRYFCGGERRSCVSCWGGCPTGALDVCVLMVRGSFEVYAVRILASGLDGWMVLWDGRTVTFHFYHTWFFLLLLFSSLVLFSSER